MRINKHPILTFTHEEKLHFTFNGKSMVGYQGDTIAAALFDNGIRHFSDSVFYQRPRGLYCAIGNCGSCYMTVDGKENVKTCLTLLKEGMDVESKVGDQHD